ncbi:heterokaryon incompatibility protein-domain-containing protein [Podospora aff. communis PSN243]|uniref:Heterokaryon incompatibility protein-domain-containing protein n=1 Tax=Podospora aff. communis PSN243 TaxID=3040156 RepID=A0AAV9GIQ9_9PEZI|nr:heterokaryon incompatibility protein-domain-containing protein [Podospora aff. communis PSN243]
MDRLKVLRHKFNELKTEASKLSHLTPPLPDAYEYARLPTDPGTAFIRVFELLPSGSHSSHALLQGRLIPIDIAADPAPSYDALSYSWGRDIPTGRFQDLGAIIINPTKYRRIGGVERLPRGDPGHRPILCDGKTLFTQPNLHDFLLRMARHPTISTRRIWIDAICIQQDEDDPSAKREKLAQLAIMGRIYSGAEAVYVWLGESRHVSARFVDYLRDLGPDFDVRPASSSVSGGDQGKGKGMEREEYLPYLQENDILEMVSRAPDTTARALRAWGLSPEATVLSWLNTMRKVNEPTRALVKVLARDYFQRAWVVQELTLARRLLFLLGDMEISQEHLLRGVSVLKSMERGDADIAGFGFNVLRLIPTTGHYALPHLLKAREDISRVRQVERDREASAPKDKVASLLGLVDEGMAETLMGYIQQDQEWDAFTHTYMGCAIELAKRNGWPYVLRLTKEQPLPSWVPDLRVPLFPKPFDYFGCKHYRAATHVKPAVFELTGGQPGDRFQWTLSLSAAEIDTIVQETTMDALLRTMTGDIFKRLPLMQDRLGSPSTKLRRQFTEYISELCHGRDEEGFTGFMMKRWAPNMHAASMQGSHSEACVAPAAQLNQVHRPPPVFHETRAAFIAAHQSADYPLKQELWLNPTLSAEQESRSSDRGLTTLSDSDVHRRRVSASASQGNRTVYSGYWLRKYRADIKRQTGRDMPSIPMWRTRKVGETRPRSKSMPPLVLSVSNEKQGLERHILRGGRRFGHVRSPADADVDEPYTTAFEEEYQKQGGNMSRLPTMALLFRTAQENRDVRTAIKSIMRDRRLFRTERHGFMGVVHDCVRNGDVVVLLAGASTPFVLRPVEDEEGRRGDSRVKKYSLVGSAYVHGIMYGELMQRSPLRAVFKTIVLV